MQLTNEKASYLYINGHGITITTSVDELTWYQTPEDETLSCVLGKYYGSESYQLSLEMNNAYESVKQCLEEAVN